MDRHEEGRTGEAIFSVEGKGKVFVGVEQHAPSLHKAFVPLLVRVNRFVDFRFVRGGILPRGLKVLRCQPLKASCWRSEPLTATARLPMIHSCSPSHTRRVCLRT